MSTTIDQRVVEMRFDNKQFESGVSQTMSTLDKLKAKLNLSGASKGLDGLNAAAKNVNMSGLGSAVDTVTAKFSALQVMGVTALANITNSAVNAGKRIVKSLTIDPIMTGFSEYETKMGSIQTILANTEHQGTTMDDVTRALDELNLYADKTIYNFQEMTRNIGTFTAAGVDLETSVRSIQGIANLAAVSGSTSQQASTAMYQLSQALATGTVKLMDWNSVVNAGMGGKVFQNALIRTAAVMAGAADDVEAWQKKNIDAYGSFRDSLTQGEWLTSEVLTRTLEQFTMAAEEGSEQWEAFKKSLMTEGYTEKQAEEILKMANTATDAATKVKTFTQLMDTLKESAQSGWAQTWEILIGDFEEAKAFFTELSDLFGGIIGDSANRRNNWLTEVFSSNWDKLISQINEAGVETEQFEDSIRKVVGDDKLDHLIEQYGSLEAVIRAGKIPADDLKTALDGIAGSGADTTIAGFVEGLKEVERTLRRGDVGEDVKKVQTALNELGYDLGAPGIDGIIGPITEAAIKAFQAANGLTVNGIVDEETLAALEKAGTTVNELTGDVDGLSESCSSLIDVITAKSGRELLLNSLMNVIKAIQRPLSAVSEALRNTFSISPDTLYNGLVKLEEITSKFVPKGVLDATTWAELIRNVRAVGIDADEFIGRLKETLTSHGIDVDGLVKRYGSLSQAFAKGAISLDYIKETLLSFDGITETLLLGGETADKVRRTFEGLFAIIDIIATITGGALRIGFEVLTELLGRFDLDILDVTANIGDAIVGFRDWLDSLINISGIVDYILPGVESFIGFVKDLVKVVKKSTVFKNFIGYLQDVRDGFAQLVLDIPLLDSFKNLMNVLDDCRTSFASWINTLVNSDKTASEIIAGLVQGLIGGAKAVLGAAMQLALDIISGICTVLGIHSPSTEMIAVGEHTIEGLVQGLKNGASALWTTIKGIGTKIIEWFKNLDFGAVFSVAVASGLVWVVKMISDALTILAKPFDGLGEMLEGAGDMFEGIGKSFKADAWEKKANAIKTFAIAIAILAAAVYVLATQTKPADLWSAVLALGMLAVIIGILSAVIGQIGASKDKGGGLVSKFKEFMSAINFGALGAALAGLAIAALGLAAVAKIIGGMDPEDAKQGIIGLAGIIGALAVFTATCGMFVRSEHSKNIKKVGGLMIKLSIAILLMVGVIKVINMLTDAETTRGTEFLIGFLGFTAVFAALGAIPGKGIEGVGWMMLRISAALYLMLGVVKLAGGLSNENGELTKANGFISSFVILVATLQFIAYIFKDGGDTSKLGAGLLGIAGAMAIMVGVAKLIATMEWVDMGKAAVGIIFLTVIISVLIRSIKKLGGDAPKIAGTLLAISVAMGILAGIAILMSMMSVEGLIKGLSAVTVLGLVMAAMIWAARGVNGCMKELIVMTVAVGLLAGVVAALSLIDPTPLWSATLAMSLLMGVFAIVIASANNVSGSWSTLLIMTGAVTILGGIIYLLADLPVEGVLGSAKAMSLLLITIVGSLKILSTVKSMSIGALICVGIMVGVIGLLGLIVGALSKIECAPSVETAHALSELLIAMSLVFVVLGLAGGMAGTAIAGAAAMMVCVAIIGGIALAIGAMMNTIDAKDIAEWKTGLEDFMDFIVILTTGLGEAIGGFAGGIMDGIASGIDTFSTSIGKLTDVLKPFIEAVKGIDVETVDGIQNLVGCITAITGSSIVEKISSCFGGSSMETFGPQLVAFGTSLKNYAAEVAGLDAAAVTNSATAAQGLVRVAQAIPGDGLLGLDGIDDFGRNIVTFGKSMKSYATEVAGLDVAAVVGSAGAAQALVRVAQAIPSDGFLGLDGIDDFGRNIKTFGKAMKSYSEQVADVDSGAISRSVGSAMSLIIVARSIPADGFLGLDGIDDFGRNIKTFGKAMKSYSDEVAEVNSDAVSKSVGAAMGLVTVARLIPDDGSLGLDGIDDFGSNVKSFGKSMKGYSDQVVDVDAGAVYASIGAAQSLVSLINTLSGLNTSGVASFKTAVDNLAQVNVSGVVQAFRSASASLVSVGSSMMDSVIRGVNAKQSQLKASMYVVVAGAAMHVKTAAATYSSVGIEIASRIASGILSKSSTIQSAGKTAASKAGSGARSGYSGAYSAGSYVGSGFVAGIKARYTEAYWAGFNLGLEGKRGLEDALSIASPSKVAFRDGKWFGEGLINGMGAMTRAVYSSSASLGLDAMNGLSSSISNIASVIESDIDAQPTIRPVLDLSNVKTGADAISDMLGVGSSIGVMNNVGAVSSMMGNRGQNGVESEVVMAIDKLRKELGNVGNTTYSINGITYDDGSNIAGAMREIVRAARNERRV